MTTAQIAKLRELEVQRAEIKAGAAIEIRQLLDEARKAYGAQEWDDGDLEAVVLELVTEGNLAELQWKPSTAKQRGTGHGDHANHHPRRHDHLGPREGRSAAGVFGRHA